LVLVLISSAEKLFAIFKYKVKIDGNITMVMNNAAREIQKPFLCNKNNFVEPIMESINQTSIILIKGMR
jgi:hypothetical protein